MRIAPLIGFVLIGWLALGAAPSEPAPSKQPVGPSEQLQFQQQTIQAQMRELEGRMFHLAELTRQLEPDDSARLLMAVRRAREQLIVEQMKEVLELINQKDLTKAAEGEQQVLVKLEELKKLLMATDADLQMQLEQLKKLQEAIKKLDAAIKEEQRQRDATDELKKLAQADAQKFKGLEQDQQQNQKATDAVASSVKALGQIGSKAVEPLASASQSMTSAAASLGQCKGGDAMVQQVDALKQMQAAREELQKQREKLQAEIERQVRKQVIANLTEMLERQKGVRNATQQFSTRVASGDREAALSVRQLAIAEQRIVTIAQQTIELVNETQFSVTLPPALQNIQRRCVYITNDLAQSRAGEKTIAAEVQVEKDLADLIETFKELSSASARPSNCKGCKGDKNKLLAELKVLKLLQTRVNEETLDADGRRAAAASSSDLLPELRGLIGTVKENQTRVRDATESLHKRICPHCLEEE